MWGVNVKTCKKNIWTLFLSTSTIREIIRDETREVYTYTKWTLELESKRFRGHNDSLTIKTFCYLSYRNLTQQKPPFSAFRSSHDV